MLKIKYSKYDDFNYQTSYIISQPPEKLLIKDLSKDFLFYLAASQSMLLFFGFRLFLNITFKFAHDLCITKKNKQRKIYKNISTPSTRTL